MVTIEFLGVPLEVDLERTRRLYKGFWPRDFCECDVCSNARLSREDVMSLEQKRLLEALHLDLRTPYHSSWIRWAPVSRDYTQRISCWFVHGRLLEGENSPVLRPSRHQRLWVDSRRDRLNRIVEGLAREEPMEGDLLYVVSIDRLPIFFRQVRGFREDYVEKDCSRCGSSWRLTGYLKRRSLVPLISGHGELNQILRDRKKRVYVEFCSRCGQMEYRIVENRPPFRTKNTLDRNESCGRVTITITRPIEWAGEIAIGKILAASEGSENP